MTTIQVETTKEEFTAIRKYASMCGEDISDLVRKIVIQEITLMKSHSANDPVQYKYHMLIPVTASAEEERKIIESNYNTIRKILGWGKIRLS